MKIGAVIVTYNPNIEDLSLLINSITSSTYKIIIVDNGSANIELVKELFSDKCQTIELFDNMGIGFAQNRGIENLLNDTQVDAVILFDHDSHPEEDMIPTLSTEFKKLKQQGIKIGAIGPVYIDKRTQKKYPISIFSGFKLLHKYPQEGDNTPIFASFLIASGCMIHRDTFREVGLMNEEFFIDYIDIEWSFRAKSFGFDLYATPLAKMDHKIGDDRLSVLGREISLHSPLRRYYLARNSVLMLKKGYINWQYKVRESFYTFSRVFVYLLLVNHKATYLKYIINGWYDGILNRVGKSRFSR